MYYTYITFPDSSPGEKNRRFAVVVARQPRSTHAISPGSKIQRHNSGARPATFRKRSRSSISRLAQFLGFRPEVGNYPDHRGLLRLETSLSLPLTLPLPPPPRRDETDLAGRSCLITYDARHPEEKEREKALASFPSLDAILGSDGDWFHEMRAERVMIMRTQRTTKRRWFVVSDPRAPQVPSCWRAARNGGWLSTSGPGVCTSRERER